MKAAEGQAAADRRAWRGAGLGGPPSLNAQDLALLAGLPGPFVRWYKDNARDLPWRKSREPYRVWLSEIMLQQTRAEAAKGHYLRFLEALPDIRALALADEETVNKLWEGLGYYRRALNLHRAAQIVVRDMGGEFPSTYEGVMSLPGIGDYTAGAIASICFGLPKPAADGNVFRLLARILDSGESIDRPAFRKRIRAGLEAVMTEAAAEDGAGFDAGAFNQSLMEAGATLCLPKGMPRCGRCPAKPFCRSLRSGRAELLPVRDLRKARRAEERTVLILRTEAGGDAASASGRIALRRRGEKGLLAGLWELPNTAGRLNPDEALALAASWGAKPLALERAAERVHVFSHIEWRMTGYVILCEEAEEGGAVGAEAPLLWTTSQAREKAFPLPSAFRVFLEETQE